MPKAKSKTPAEKPESANNEKDPIKEAKLADADQFMDRLFTRTGRVKKHDGDMKIDKEEGEKMAEYLDKVVPNWESMRSTRLYKHIQKMLENAERIRRFEIGLIWRRVVYFVPLLVLFFTAFGGLFYFFFESYSGSSYLGSKELLFLLIAMFIIASINAFLSFCLARIIVGSHGWQENWMQHVDYLQTILGLNLMRVYLPRKAKYLTITKTNILISTSIFTIWALIAFINFLVVIYFSFSPFSISSLINEAIIFLILVVILSILVFFTFWSYKILTGEKFCKKSYADVAEKMGVNKLQKFNYIKAPSSKRCKCCCKPCTCDCC